MLQYIVEIENPKGTAFYAVDHRIFECDERAATHFDSYVEAVQHIAEFLHNGNSGLSEPVEIHIIPVPERNGQASSTTRDDEWSIEDILRNAG
jgi:hypothetical protein